LYNKNLKLPLNTKAVLKKRIKNDKDFDYIELVYPEIPSERFIKENSHINGSATVDVKEYLKNQTPEDLDKIKTNLMSASENLNSSLSAIGGMFILIQDILNDNRDNLKNASSNLKNTTKNINNVTKKFDNIIIEEQWNNTFGNIEKSSNGVNNFAQNINKTVNDIDRTIPITLENTKEITANLNSISCGIRQTLSKKFGGLRLFFGRVINEN
jgi:methyl-accepting chemotaxis protein